MKGVAGLVQKKIYRSRTQKIIAGVCGGVAEYFNIDVTLVRLVWVLVTLPGFFPGIILYIVAAVIIPESPYAYYGADDQNDAGSSNSFYNEFNKGSQSSDGHSKFLVIIGLILIAVGGLTLFRNLFPSIWHVIKKLIVPVSIIVAGSALIYSATKR